jgi:hypothetical protein
VREKRTNRDGGVRGNRGKHILDGRQGAYEPVDSGGGKT